MDNTLYSAEIFLFKTRYQRFSPNWNHYKCLSYLIPIHMNTSVTGLRILEIFQFFQRGDRLYTSESDVYRRRILMYKDGPHAERVKTLIRVILIISTMIGYSHKPISYQHSLVCHKQWPWFQNLPFLIIQNRWSLFSNFHRDCSIINSQAEKRKP